MSDSASAPCIDGLILLDKPAGRTSHDCVALVRKLLPRSTKVGHSGTLDPFSTGLLILLVGRGTRLAQLLQGMDKTYEGVLRFGEGTDTFDRDGKVVATGPAPELDPEGWRRVVRNFIGPQDQLPPDYSAKRVGGKRAYDLARKGLSVELEPSRVEIYRFDVEPASDTDLRFALHCSSGTYIRAVARDIGDAVGTPAHCRELRRTGIGPYRIETANPVGSPLDPSGIVPFDGIDLGIPVHRVDYREERMLLFGQKIPGPQALQGTGHPVKIIGPTGRFVALAKAEGRQLQPMTVFPPPEGSRRAASPPPYEE